MLRPIVLLLLLLNLGFLTWSQGWIEQLVGQAVIAGREPERLKRQVAPDSIKVVPASVSALAAAQAPGVCLESPLLADDEALRAAKAALERVGVAAGFYTDQRTDVPGVWGVATIRMPNADFQARKEATLNRLRIAFEVLKGFPAEAPSLLISRHASEAEAQEAMDALGRHSIKGLRVLQLSAPVSAHRLRIEQADAGLQSRLAKLKDPALGAGFGRCAASAEIAASAPPVALVGAPASAASR